MNFQQSSIKPMQLNEMRDHHLQNNTNQICVKINLYEIPYSKSGGETH